MAEQLALLAQHPDVEVGDQDDDPAATVGPVEADLVSPRTCLGGQSCGQMARAEILIRVESVGAARQESHDQ